MEGGMTEMPITTTEEKAHKRLELELLDEKLSQEDVNKKLLRSLSPEWNTHAVVWRNKADLDTMSMDDLYNNLKSDQAEEGPNYAPMAFSSASHDSKKSELRVLVLPPYTRNFMPPTPDLSFTGLDEFVNKPVVENYKAMSSKEEPKVVRKYDDAPSIEE
nr:ribonuclease H-like domain-containing protein [Tanacetum cinerariifolium]